MGIRSAISDLATSAVLLGALVLFISGAIQVASGSGAPASRPGANLMIYGMLAGIFLPKAVRKVFDTVLFVRR